MKTRLAIFCFFLLLNYSGSSQSTTEEFFFLFYNVENLFDPWDDKQTADEEFTPAGDRHWSYKRLNKKLQNISKVILSASGWTPPHLIALCEVENRYVLEKLLKETPLHAYPYHIIHKESPDPRGIDVALLYNNEEFYPLEYRYIPLQKNTNSILASREILYVQGLLGNSDTLHLFINHWPSRYSGLLESQAARNLAAATLRSAIESVQQNHILPKIIIAGDFNDQPTNESLVKFLGSKAPTGGENGNQLYNLSLPWMKEEIKTLKHQTQWSVFDQIIVSGSLLENETGMATRPEWAQIISLPFLTEKDERYGGVKPNRTYYGFRYHGGFSDHLPVLLKIRKDLPGGIIPAH